METAIVSKAMWDGDSLYQQRARQALPVLVRQALSGSHLTYGALAQELGMPNPRNLNYVLGSVGQTLLDMPDIKGLKIPPIQCLVVNQSNDTPGQGFGWFMPDPDEWKRLTPLQRRRATERLEQDIYAFPYWNLVLQQLSLDPVREDFDDLSRKAAGMSGGGESPDHFRLKEYVQQNPHLVGAKTRGCLGRTEERLPSGDSIDVFFDAAHEWIAVEVKSILSDEADLTRGMYQCIKYTAVLRAMASVSKDEGVDVRAVLVISGRLSERLLVLKNRLGVDVIEGVIPK